jgi:hypothetical protein
MMFITLTLIRRRILRLSHDEVTGWTAPVSASSCQDEVVDCNIRSEAAIHGTPAAKERAATHLPAGNWTGHVFSQSSRVLNGTSPWQPPQKNGLQLWLCSSK